MSFTSTTNYALQKPAVGTELDAWGDDLNTNLDLIDTRMKLNADAAAAASTLAGTKAAAVHTHNATDINAGTLAAARMPALTGEITSTVNTVATTITTAAVTNAKLANMAAATIKGSVAGGVPADLTATQVTALLNPFTSTLKGLAPLSGGGTVNFLRADGTWAAPGTTSGGGIVTKSVSSTLLLTDAGNLVEMSVAGANTLTIPTNAAVPFPVNTEIDIVQLGVGQTTINGPGVILRASGGKLKLTAQYSGATIKKRGTDDWLIWGDLSA